jgi:hypothetical protein
MTRKYQQGQNSEDNIARNISKDRTAGTGQTGHTYRTSRSAGVVYPVQAIRDRTNGAVNGQLNLDRPAY